MTIIQTLAMAIGVLALVISAELVRSTLRQRRQAPVELSASSRQVGTFGGLPGFSNNAGPLHNTGSAGHRLMILVCLAAFLGASAIVKVAWDEANPDIRSAYGRAYERCVREEKVSRWKIKDVERCIDARRASPL